MGKALTFLCASVSSSAKQVSSLCQLPEAQPARAILGDPGTAGPLLRQHRGQSCWRHGVKPAHSPAGYGKREEQRSLFLIPYTNSQKCIFTLAHMSSPTKPFFPFGAFLLYSCLECYQLVWAGGKIFKALECLLLEQQQPFWSPSPAGFQWALGYPSACFFNGT